MNNKKLMKGLLPAAVSLAMIGQAQAAITLYDQDETTFSTDGFFNTFYVSGDYDPKDGSASQSQSRVKMGFLPNTIGFNFSKNVDGLKVGGRSSFWVTINDSNTTLTDNAIDVRQFYATIGGDFGEILIGKDFTLFNRSNIFNDEILLGYGQTVDNAVGPNAQGVSFGNIGAGYLYPFPNAQITYRTPDMGGFKVALGIMDPNTGSANSTFEESAPRFEAEAVYSGKFDGGSYSAWVGGMTQSSEQVGGNGKVDSDGFSYGIKLSLGGLSVSASGFTAEGVGLAGLDNLTVVDSAAVGLATGTDIVADEVDGYLVQASYTLGSSRFVASYGENEGDALVGTTVAAGALDLESTSFAVFHTFNANVTLVGEFTTSETDAREADTIALGAVVTF